MPRIPVLVHSPFRGFKPGRVRRVPIDDHQVRPPRVPDDARMYAAAHVSAIAELMRKKLADKEGTPREQLQVPIAPAGRLRDDVDYEASDVHAPPQYVPRYRLRSENGRFHMRFFERTPGGPWALEVALEPYFAESLGARSGATPVAGLALDVVLRYRKVVARAPVGAKEISFHELTWQGDVLVALAELTSDESADLLVRRKEVYGALRDPALGAELVVRRRFSVAVPIRGPRIRNHVPITAAHAGRDLPSRSPSRSPDPPRYRVVTADLPWTVEPVPFAFPFPNEDYLFPGMTGPAPTTEPTPRTVLWKGWAYPYYQNPDAPHCFDYLPDAYKIIRRLDTPHAPCLFVTFDDASADAEDPERLIATLRYLAAPYVDEARLEDARAKLVEHVPPGSPPIAFELMTPPSPRLQLWLPQEAGGVVDTARPEAKLLPDPDLGVVIEDVLNLKWSRFERLFNSLFSDADPVFQGTVAVTEADGPPPLRFIARADDAVGPVLELSLLAGDAADSFIVARNVIESPVEWSAPSVTLAYPDGQTRLGVVQDVALPLCLGPGESVTFKVAPDKAPPEGVPDVHVTADGARVLPDRAALLQAVLATDGVPQFRKVIRVKGFPEMFDPPAGGGARIVAILVKFEDGQDIELTHDHLEGTTTLHTPITARLLRTADTSAYRYKLKIVRTDGQRVDNDWRSSDDDILYPDVT